MNSLELMPQPVIICSGDRRSVFRLGRESAEALVRGIHDYFSLCPREEVHAALIERFATELPVDTALSCNGGDVHLLFNAYRGFILTHQTAQEELRLLVRQGNDFPRIARWQN